MAKACDNRLNWKESFVGQPLKSIILIILNYLLKTQSGATPTHIYCVSFSFEMHVLQEKRHPFSNCHA